MPAEVYSRRSSLNYNRLAKNIFWDFPAVLATSLLGNSISLLTIIFFVLVLIPITFSLYIGFIATHYFSATIAKPEPKPPVKLTNSTAYIWTKNMGNESLRIDIPKEDNND